LREHETVKSSFSWIGGHPAVDFCNTEHLVSGEWVDHIECDQEIMRWAKTAGFEVRAAAVGAASTEFVHGSLREVRSAIRTLFECRIDFTVPPHRPLEVLNRALKWKLPGDPLHFHNGIFERAPLSVGTPIEVMHALAEDAAKILATDAGKRLRRCSSDSCVLLFLDTSRAGTRRWCSMKVCGNRAKVAAHLTRRRRR